MAIDRRQLLAGASLSLTSALFAANFAHGLETNAGQLLVTAARKPNGSFALIVLTADGKIVREIPLSGRGHDFAIHKPTGVVVSFARRPGRFALAFHPRDSQPPKLFAPPIERHFYGHGVFSHDGKLLFATENDFDSARGIIGVYDATSNYARIGEFPSYGVGPHDVHLLRNGRTLVVANGGIETHPDSGREKLNIATMKPSLCFIDADHGSLIIRHELDRDLHKLSIRHLASDSHDNVWFGGQWQGDTDAIPFLVGSAGIDVPLKLLDGAAPSGASLNGYVGSVAISANGRWLAASAPRAGNVVYFDTQEKRKPIVRPILDGCGVTQLGGPRFAISSGHGVVRTESPLGTTHRDAQSTGLAFDNHMRLVM